MRNRNREESTRPDNPIAREPRQLLGHIGQDVDTISRILLGEYLVSGRMTLRKRPTFRWSNLSLD
ncbi:hypothetical protein Pyn_28002 [Prunus yedoensis var. nudiflora]|uniref:Uncharacterized protein n=1 Tax=Prunus yedoensis var. nudiflora TaxID=2094558 RepID=A0A314Y6Z1_PRUYE|nr:hypothetical protein Pyn_28002 [Prunus yedoensis var. nudiflora]